MKQCTRCKEKKPYSEFWTHRKSGYQSMCKPCASARRREYYLANKEAEEVRIKAWEAKTKEFFRELKNNPCSDCGNIYHFAAMTWDHRPGTDKLGNVGNMITGFISKKKVLEEIAKCDLVCANCHAVRTWKRANGGVA